MSPSRAAWTVVAAVSAAALVAAACEETGTNPLLPPAADEIVVGFDADPSALPAGDWSLREAVVDGDTLTLEIEHGGGCREHRYWLVAVEGFTELPTQGPIPTFEVPVRLAHDDGGDPCEALLRATLDFGLAPLEAAYRDESGGTGPAMILLRVPEGQGAAATRSVTFRVE